MDLTLLIFLLVYVVMGLGKLPGLRVDRTGAAVVGALAMIVVGSISAKGAWMAIDYRTVGLLFGLMVVSASFSVSGFYGWAARRVALLPLRPAQLVAVLVAVGAGLSAVLTKDVVAVAMVPLLVSLTLARKLNPTPFLLAFCFAVNTGSTATLIGSPQNMITGQTLGISFNDFVLATGVPAVLSLPIVWAMIVFMYRGKWQLANAGQAADPARAPAVPALDRLETYKSVLVALAVMAAFVFSGWPHELVALAAASVLLISRRISSHDVLGHVDGNLLLLIAGLFVVNAAMAATGLPQQLLGSLEHLGMNLNDPLTLYGVGAVLSNLVGNNPAVMLLVPYLDTAVHVDATAAALVLGTGFSSNLVIFGSLAGIITVEQSALFGVKISFGEFFRAGGWITLLTMLMAALWVLFLGLAT
ncbi:SLC13 family permease [Castellaniella sp.]|uniref:SLC13 family permease n=1 Tax=Castellaniella sp. TaxID=1955812 RepID=UPI003569BD62